MENVQKRKFSLLTTVAMIVGIVIGSGIFFKTDNILAAVDGSVFLGVLAWILGGIGIVFGTLSVAVLAKRDEKVGGLISYCEMTWGKTLGYLAGWFQTLIYYPTLNAVIAWVASMYFSMLMGWTEPGTIFGIAVNGLPAWTFPFSVNEWIVTLLFLAGIYALNIFQTIWAGRFQSFAMFVKIAALIVLAFTGLTLGEPSTVTHMADLKLLGGGFFAALVPIAYSYDGWQVAPSIAHEIKNPKRNMPLALMLSPLLIMTIYIAYFLGINAVLGPEKVLELGDGAVSVFAQQFFGDVGYRVVLAAVSISVLGTLNGLTLGYIRLPYALALRNELPGSEKLAKVDPKTDIPMFAAVVTIALTIFWLFVHFATTTGVIFLGWSLFSGISIDEISIMLIYLFMIAIFAGVIKDYTRKLVGNPFEGVLFPVLAIIGGLFALYGAIQSPKVAVYLGLSVAVILAGLLVKPKHS